MSGLLKRNLMGWMDKMGVRFFFFGGWVWFLFNMIFLNPKRIRNFWEGKREKEEKKAQQMGKIEGDEDLILLSLS